MLRIKMKTIIWNLGVFLVGFSGYFAVSGDEYAFEKVLFCAILGTIFIGLGGGFNDIKRKKEENENKGEE